MSGHSASGGMTTSAVVAATGAAAAAEEPRSGSNLTSTSTSNGSWSDRAGCCASTRAATGATPSLTSTRSSRAGCCVRDEAAASALAVGLKVNPSACGCAALHTSTRASKCGSDGAPLLKSPATTQRRPGERRVARARSWWARASCPFPRASLVKCTLNTSSSLPLSRRNVVHSTHLPGVTSKSTNDTGGTALSVTTPYGCSDERVTWKRPRRAGSGVPAGGGVRSRVRPARSGLCSIHSASGVTSCIHTMWAAQLSKNARVRGMRVDRAVSSYTSKSVLSVMMDRVLERLSVSALGTLSRQKKRRSRSQMTSSFHLKKYTRCHGMSPPRGTHLTSAMSTNAFLIASKYTMVNSVLLKAASVIRRKYSFSEVMRPFMALGGEV
mmetsp:Transcript_24357/g.61047  ORF Transcript_24357/g.61047 Transcript_24357/m.61047 type:complete len:383 (+) Transcript_24357:502-1650(+)